MRSQQNVDTPRLKLPEQATVSEAVVLAVTIGCTHFYDDRIGRPGSEPMSLGVYFGNLVAGRFYEAFHLGTAYGAPDVHWVSTEPRRVFDFTRLYHGVYRGREWHPEVLAAFGPMLKIPK